jgi:hypothetical protein
VLVKERKKVAYSEYTWGDSAAAAKDSLKAVVKGCEKAV